MGSFLMRGKHAEKKNRKQVQHQNKFSSNKPTFFKITNEWHIFQQSDDEGFRWKSVPAACCHGGGV